MFGKHRYKTDIIGNQQKTNKYWKVSYNISKLYFRSSRKESVFME